MTEPEEVSVAGLRIRKASIGSCSMLARLKNPFSDFKAVAQGVANFTFSDVAEFIFIHAAPREEVSDLVYGGDRAALAKRADEFLVNVPASEFENLLNAIVGDAQAVEAAQAEAVKAVSSKNEQRPAV